MEVIPAPPDAEDLADALRDGRPEAFEQLYGRLHARVFNLAARIVHDPHDAADITQDVFVTAFTSLPRGGARVRPEAWVYRVTVNACYDHLRRAARRQACALPEGDTIAAGEDVFEQSETAGAVEVALQSLSPRYRAALVLKDLHGLDTGEVAEVMGTTRATARVVLFRARSAFRRAFGGAAPAGTATAPGLAAFLPELPVPAALQAPPSFAGLTPAGPIAVPAPVPPATLLAKAGTALGAKAAMVAAAAAIVAGGGVAVEHARTDAPVVKTDPAGGAAATVDASTTPSCDRLSPGRSADQDRTRRGIADARDVGPRDGVGPRPGDTQGRGADGARSGGTSGAIGQTDARRGGATSHLGGTVDSAGGSGERSMTGSGGGPAGGGGQDAGGDSPGAAGDDARNTGGRAGEGTLAGGGPSL